MRDEGKSAREKDTRERVSSILEGLSLVVDAESPAFAELFLDRAFRAIRAAFPYTGPLSPEDRYSLGAVLFRAEAAAKTFLRPSFFDERGRHGFAAARCVFDYWAEGPGPDGRKPVWPKRPDLNRAELILRIVANDLDTLCAAASLVRLNANVRASDFLLPSGALAPRPASAASLFSSY